MEGNNVVKKQMKNNYPLFIYSILYFSTFLMTPFMAMASALNDEPWQMRVDYNIEVKLNTKNHVLEGTQRLKLYNQSPDTLHKVFYHLYWNAFQPGSDLDIRAQWIRDTDPRIRGRLATLKEDEIGFVHVNHVKSKGERLHWKIQGTILEVNLSELLLPNDSIELDMKFTAQVPVQIRRCGRNSKEGIDYSMSQWYPKLCNYDRQGWHTNPYIFREFYGIWGNYRVCIQLDHSYVVAATGVLLNPQDNEQSEKNEREKKWIFEAKNVHDFVWAADADYKKIKHTTKNGLDILFYYQPDPRFDDAWTSMPLLIAEAFNFLESTFGPYPYPSYSFIQAGDGGMEYPMATLITGQRSLGSLLGTSLHELCHAWFQFMLASNESLYPWMGEGFASYAKDETMNHLIEVGLIPGAKIDESIYEKSAKSYIDFTYSGLEEPLCTHSDHYSSNTAYAVGAYTKGKLCLVLLKYIVGKETFDKSMLDYYWKWRFRHPTPNDFFRIMEKNSDLELDWFSEYFVHSTKHMDYSVDSVFSSSKHNTTIQLNRIQDFPMPIELKIVLTNGTVTNYYIPLDLMRGHGTANERKGYNILPIWPWVQTTYEFQCEFSIDKIKEIIIDPNKKLLDIDFTNNYWISKQE